MELSAILQEIDGLSGAGSTFKPHKYLLLLSVVELFGMGSLHSSNIYYDEQLKSTYKKFFDKYAGYDDRNRPYTPFFHLQSSSFWSLVPKSGKEEELRETSTVGGPGSLEELVHCATLSDVFYHALATAETRDVIREKLVSNLLTRNVLDDDNHINLYHDNTSNSSGSFLNNYIAYLNTLQNTDANSDNSLAEAQAINQFFSQIHVAHPLVDQIQQVLISDAGNTHVILTGHAGDGKSTIALELYKRLKGLPVDQPLDIGIQPREELQCGEVRICVIKDLSEWTEDEQQVILGQMMAGDAHFLLISNTGCLLNLFTRYAHASGSNPIALEGNLLEAIENEGPWSWEGIDFTVYNLALRDNLTLALQMWQQMLDAPEWQKCTNCQANNACPIFSNITLIQKHHQLIRDRLLLAYRRIYEYGTRLTIRQLGAHLAYMLTANLDCQQVHRALQAGESFHLTEHYFFNRYFGDTGDVDDIHAAQLHAVMAVNQQEFGHHLCPSMERQLWMAGNSVPFHIGIEELEEDFSALLQRGKYAERASGRHARIQVRRMLYFLHQPVSPGAQTAYYDRFLAAFLNSPMIRQYVDWQTAEAPLSLTVKESYRRRLFQVLQEHCCGVRMLEDASSPSRLYITLNRQQNNIRQSAQVVLASIDFNASFDLLLQRSTKDGKRNMVLQGKGEHAQINLLLNLPFLDYMMLRQQGEVGKLLQLTYVDRLERFKNRVLTVARRSNEHEILLLRLNTDHRFQQQRFSVTHGKLEVAHD